MNDKSKDTMEKIRQKYAFLNLSDKEFINIIKDEFEILLNSDEKDNKKLLTKVKNKIINLLNEYLKEQLEGPKASIILNNYIEQNIRLEGNLDKNLTELKKIDDMNHQLNSCFDVDIIINNSTIESILNNIVSNNQKKLKEEGISSVTDSLFISLLIEMYCEKISFDIKKEESQIIDDNDGNLSEDITKMYLNEIHKYPLLSRQEEYALWKRMQHGDKEAENILVERNLKFVVTVARKFTNKGLSLLDLIQEGNIGLIKAVKKFDASRGYKLCTYAQWYIMQSIGRAVENTGRSVRLPVHMSKKIKSYQKVYVELLHELNREPELEEMREKLKWSQTTLSNVREACQEIVSLNTLIGEDEDCELMDLVDSKTLSIEETYLDEQLNYAIMTLLPKCNLDERTIKVLTYRYGLDGGKPMKLDAIGKIFGVSRERIRQIEAKALRKIRQYGNIKDYAVYVNDPDEACKYIDDLHKAKRKKIRKQF